MRKLTAALLVLAVALLVPTGAVAHTHRHHRHHAHHRRHRHVAPRRASAVVRAPTSTAAAESSSGPDEYEPAIVSPERTITAAEVAQIEEETQPVPGEPPVTAAEEEQSYDCDASGECVATSGSY